MGIFGVVSESVLCDRLFDCFDSGSRGSINFAEYSSSLETMTKGGVNEKLEFAFKMMDSGSKGFIAMEDLSVMLQSVINVYYGMLGQPTRQVTAREVARIFMQLDQTGNGSVTISEFKMGVRKHPGMMTDFDRLGGTHDYDDEHDDAFESDGDGDGDGGGESAAESAAESVGEGRAVSSAMASMRLGPGGEEHSVLLHRGSVAPQRRPRFGGKSTGLSALLAKSAEDSAVFIAIATAKLERARLLSEKLCAAVPQPAVAAVTAVAPPPVPCAATAAAGPADADVDADAGDDDDENDADGGDALPDDPALLARALQLEIVKLQAELATHTDGVRGREAALAKLHRRGRPRRRSHDAQSLHTPLVRLPLPTRSGSPMRSPTQETLETPLRGLSWGTGLSSQPPAPSLESPPLGGRAGYRDGADGTTASDSEGGNRAASKSEPALKLSSSASGASSSQKLARRVRQSTVGSARRAFKRRKRRQDRLSKRMMRSRDASKGVTVFPGHRNWDLMMNVMQGIQLSVGRMASASAFSYSSRPISVHDFAIKEKYTLTGHQVLQGSANFLKSIAMAGTPAQRAGAAAMAVAAGGDAASAASGGAATKAKAAGAGGGATKRALKSKVSIVDDTPMAPRFVDYAPHVFRSLRALFGVGSREYMRSIGPANLLGNLLLGNLSTMSQLGSEGKSGSFFYFTADGCYMVKTLSAGEHKFFREILPSYYEHMVRNPNSLLCRFMGLHQLRFSKHSKIGSQKVSVCRAGLLP